MLGADLGRMVLIGSIPIAAAFGIPALADYIVALATGLLSVFFDVAYQSFVPVLVGRDRLVEGDREIGAAQAIRQRHRSQHSGRAHRTRRRGTGHGRRRRFIRRKRDRPGPAADPRA